MNHHTTSDFWDDYGRLPEAVRRLADAHYELLRSDPRHPSLHFKRVGRLWSVRVGIGYRALAVDSDDGPVWYWIGSHAQYDRIIQGCVFPADGHRQLELRTPPRNPMSALNRSHRAARWAELLDEDGYRLPGFDKANRVPLKGDSLRHQLTWKEKTLADLPAGRYLLRVHLQQAEVFAVTLN